MKNQVIEVLDRAHGRNVIEYWKSQGIDTLLMEGLNTKSHNTKHRYYGIINDRFGCFSIETVRDTSTEIIELQKEEKSFPRVMLVSMYGDSWHKRVVFMEKNDRYLAWNKAETIKESESIYEATAWRYAKEFPEKVELTKSQIAEKFGIPIDLIKIVD